MVTTKLQSDQIRNLGSQGYHIDFIGFRTPEVPLYTHRDLGADRRRGTVAAKYRVQDPRYLQPHESDHLARKAAKGLFSWPPSECMSHDFPVYRVESDRLNGSRYVVDHVEKGCRWCRKVAQSGLEAEASEVQETNVSHADEKPLSVQAEEAPPLADEFTCATCGYVVPERTKKGKKYPKASRRSTFQRHAQTHRHPSG